MQIGLGSLKIKGKSSSFVVDPNNTIKSKTQADAVLLLKEKEKYDLSKIEDSRVLISANGEYEVSGTKIAAFNADSHIFYCLDIDEIQVLITTEDALLGIKESMRDYHMIVLNVNKIIDASLITALTPRVVILYGEKSGDLAKVLGSEKEKSAKFSVKKEQIPEEMEVVVLE